MKHLKRMLMTAMMLCIVPLGAFAQNDQKPPPPKPDPPVSSCAEASAQQQWQARTKKTAAEGEVPKALCTKKLSISAPFMLIDTS